MQTLLLTEIVPVLVLALRGGVGQCKRVDRGLAGELAPLMQLGGQAPQLQRRRRLRARRFDKVTDTVGVGNRVVHDVVQRLDRTTILLLVHPNDRSSVFVTNRRDVVVVVVALKLCEPSDDLLRGGGRRRRCRVNHLQSAAMLRLLSLETRERARHRAR
jgi:hypothetical protein